MKICIYGAGAIGAYLGAELAAAGADVSFVARGPHLAAMQENGLRLHIGEQQKTVAVRCTDDPSALGPQDYVILTLKAHSVGPIVDQIQPLLGPDTAIVTAQNGILCGTSMPLAVLGKIIISIVSIRVAKSGRHWGQRGRLAASFTHPAKLLRRAW